eukprot:m.204444 g.204444  ORF g.204444 m.204444 type:complete len:349 (+) comp18470_c0_seq1:355-1401(+)
MAAAQGRAPPPPWYVLRGHAAPVTAVAFGTPNRLFSGSDDGEVRVWDLHRRRSIAVIPAAHKHAVLTVADIDGNRMLSHCRKGVVRVWQLPDGTSKAAPELLREVPGCHGSGFCNAAILPSPCGDLDKLRLCLTSDDAATLRIKTLGAEDSRTEPLLNVAIHDQPPSGMCLRSTFVTLPAHPRTVLLACYEDGSVVGWDVDGPPDAAPLFRETLHTEPVLCCAVDQKHDVIITGSADASIHFCRAEQAVAGGDKTTSMKLCKLHTIELKQPGINSLTVRTDCKLFVAGGWDGKLRFYSLPKGKPLAVLDLHQQAINATAIADTSVCEAGRLVAAGSKDGRISLWSLYP